MKKTTKTPTVERVSYVRTFPGRWPGVSEWIEVVVETRDAGGWWAYGSVGFPNERREQWNTRQSFDRREDAARFAADFVISAEELVAAVGRGEEPFMPHRAMRDACAVALDAEPNLVALAAQVVSGRERRHVLESARQDAEHAWYRAHDWRDFKPPAEPLDAVPGWEAFQTAVVALAAPRVAGGESPTAAIEASMAELLVRQRWQLDQFDRSVVSVDSDGFPLRGSSPEGKQIVALISRRVWEQVRSTARRSA